MSVFYHISGTISIAFFIFYFIFLLNFIYKYITKESAARSPYVYFTIFEAARPPAIIVATDSESCDGVYSILLLI